MVGWLDADDVSLTYDAAARVVTRHVGGASTVVGDDVFAVLEAELAGGCARRPLGRVLRLRLPARPAGRCRLRAARRGLDAAAADPVLRPPTPAEDSSACRRVCNAWTMNLRRPPGSPAGRQLPAAYATAFDQVQEHLHAGNSYEVNLTYRAETSSDLDPVTAYLRLRELNPAPYAGFLQHDLPGARAWLLSCSPERYALVTADRMLETKPIKGTTPRGRTPEEDERLRRHLAERPQVPRREPDDRRPAPQRPVDGVRAGHRRGAGADGRRVLRVRAPAGQHRPRPPAPGRHHDAGAARAVPRRLDDRRPEAAHHAGDRGGRGHPARRVLRCLRLDLRGRPGRPRRRDPEPDDRRRRPLPARHRRRHHRPLRRAGGVRRVAVEGRAAAARAVGERNARNTQ